MRINELIVESNQIDELSLAGAGKAVGNVIRGTSSAIQGAKGAWQGAKDAWNQGKQSGTYDRARAAVSGTTTPPATQLTTAQAATNTPTPSSVPAQQSSTQAAPAVTQPGTASAVSTQPAATPVTVKQINKVIPTLRNRDLQSVKKTVDTTIAKKTPAQAAPTQQTGVNPTATPSPTTGMNPAPKPQPNLQVQQGGRKTAALLQPRQAVPESKFYSNFLRMDI
jgi:hypothetical protein